MKPYDYLIAGGGCAGLAMALQLLEQVNPNANILIVDREIKTKNDRSWAFWSQDELPLGLDSIVLHQWKKLSFAAPHYERTSALGHYTYQFIRGIDYYNYCYQQLRNYPGVDFHFANIDQIAADQQGPYAWLGEEKIHANWIFDSRLHLQPKKIVDNGQYFLWQHFRGWLIETEEAAFDPSTATLMDFSVNQQGRTAFFYLLPFSERQALVEYTLFDEDLLDTKSYDGAIADYLHQKGIQQFRILETEEGKIPMTTASFPTVRHARIIPIGALGGSIKPTTGYAFMRIQEQVKDYAQQLAHDGNIQVPPASYTRFQWYDDLLLHILTEHPERGEEIFARLFRRQPFARILQFLAEDSHIAQEASLFKELPIGLFLDATWTLFRKPSVAPTQWPSRTVQNTVQ